MWRTLDHTLYLDLTTVSNSTLYLSNSAPSASQQFEGRGADELNNELTQMMTRFLSHNTTSLTSASSTTAPSSTTSHNSNGAGGINLSKLCMIPGEQCWILYVDALVLDYGGNLVDAVFMGTRAAIFDTRIPKTEVQDLGDGNFDFEVLDDAEDTEIVEGREDMPICVTLNKVLHRHFGSLNEWNSKRLPFYSCFSSLRCSRKLNKKY
jgi:exosome complex component RRP42